MNQLVLLPLESSDVVEVVERKGLGHPDTICDALAENLSRSLCAEYRNRFGTILHHNVDKALLCGGRAAPAFGGGAILAPIEIYLSGRAAVGSGGNVLPIADIAVESARTWLKSNMHALDALVTSIDTGMPVDIEIPDDIAAAFNRDVRTDWSL